MDDLAVVQGLKTLEHLDEVRPACLLGDLGLLARASQCDFIQEIAAVAKLHHDAQGRRAILHERLLV